MQAVCCIHASHFMTTHTWLQHRIWATPDKIDQVDYALNLTVDLMLYFETELDMDFHLPKLGSQWSADEVNHCVVACA